jgi:hypothetical protein
VILRMPTLFVRLTSDLYAGGHAPECFLHGVRASEGDFEQLIDPREFLGIDAISVAPVAPHRAANAA